MRVDTCGLSLLKSDTGTSKLGGEFFRVWLLAMLIGSHFSFKSPLAAESHLHHPTLHKVPPWKPLI